ncbi:T9SS sorting signal type C domain-containing protein [Flavobacterium sp. N1719]|uniref:T9SS sorting signal type C domain-containing protein n=1 Tax=Flavobacterium sp. N1719 TaxID=2885633 RepID=UPI0022215EAC|nr:T9SS sorting signal type C domain-containing protein [Flavobacterium sp. N1719]
MKKELLHPWNRIFFFFLLLTAVVSNAQTNCATAQTLYINGPCVSGTVSDNTQNTPNYGTCPGTFRRERWYTFTVSGSTQTITISASASNQNLALMLISSSSSCTGLTQIACANATDTNSAHSESITQSLTPGIYYVKVLNVGSNNNMNLTNLCITGPTPTNITCATATNLPCGTSALPGSTYGTTGATNHNTGCTMSNNGVWYSFIGDGQETTVSTTAITGFNHEMAIVSGSCGSLTTITCQDLAVAGGTETYIFNTTSGVNYYVYVASNAIGSTTGAFTISRTCAPIFNPCSTITNITTCGVANSGTISAGNGIYATSACGNTTTGRELIYSFTPTTSGYYSINQTSSFSTINYGFKTASSGCNATGLTCIGAYNGAATSGYFSLIAGTQYYFILDTNNTTGGSVNFTVNCPPTAPANDECAGAIALTVNSTCTFSNYTLVSATNSAVASPSCGNYMGGDIWYRVVVPSSGIISIDTQTGTLSNLGMALYTGSCGTLNLHSCDDDSSSNGAMPYLYATGLAAGTTAYIRIWDEGNNEAGTFEICVSTPPIPGNDNCSGATTINVNPTINCTFSVDSTTAGATLSSAGCSGTADDDVWFRFVAKDDSHIVTVTPTTLGNAVFQVYSGTCASLTSLACINNTTASTPETTTLTGLTIGATYYIRVYSFSSGSSQGDFNICVATPCILGNGIGTNSNGCVAAVVGAQGSGGVDPAPVTGCGTSTCSTLEANYTALGTTTNYTVQNIAYQPPYQFGCLANSISVYVDDVWSNNISLPFNFCYYGNNYNQVIIGSNGTVSFDTVNNTPGGYSQWSFNTNLPSNAMFLNTIFGVYHDIDPSKGGEVGWELITLPSGCRAMVIGWKDVPMFSTTCNNLLYTGMIVLYENSNIIDIYVKEKNTCASWNSGNAVIGIQNATGTAAVVAPNRNSLSADWNTTNEAWRFTPSGASISTITWYEGVGTSGPVVGTTNTINVCPVATTTYTAKVTYTFCNGTILEVTDDTTVSVLDRKTWNGSVSTDWYDQNNWSPDNAIPTLDDCVMVPVTPNNPLISETESFAEAKNLIVYNGASLTVDTNNSLTVKNTITIEPTATFTVENGGSLVQIDNVANTGNVNYKRNVSIRGYDYVYWSSPVANYNVSNIGAPTTSSYIWKWNPTIANTNGGQGNWEFALGNTMTLGRGYIVRGPNSFGNAVPLSLSTTFTGVPNNGNISYTIARGSDINTAYHTGTNGSEITNYSDNWNLVGNPYPSAIRASQFLFNNRSKILGNIKVWTHGNLPSAIASPFYNTYQYNYNPSDYLTYNFTGTSCCPAMSDDYFIGAGQGFFVQMIDGPAATNTLLFDNSLRNHTYANTTFYRSSSYINAEIANVNLERHRFWLDLVNANMVSDRTLVGYVQTATNGNDNFFDSNTMVSGNMAIFTMIGTEKFQIQGRSLPFNINDEVAVGVHIPSTGFYNIALAAVDGMFQNQAIYIKDKDLNIIHDLRVGPYRFYGNAGTRLNRFIIIYNTQPSTTLKMNGNDELYIIAKENIEVQNTLQSIEEITVFDTLGRTLGRFQGIKENEFTINSIPRNNQPLIVQVKLANGDFKTEKIIY